VVEEPVTETAYGRFFEALAQAGADGLMVTDAPENLANRRLIANSAAAARLPTIYSHRECVEVGGLMAYAPDFKDLFRHAARQIDQILKGAKPADFPFYQSTKFHLALNLNAAKSLGLTIPPALLARADEVIE
jgi:putative tryptophan/tyrosine transport system substrate-binding protein